MGTFVLVLWSMITIPSYAIGSITHWKYGVMLDAGSSSSKLKVYKWPQRSSTSEVLKLKLILNEKFRPSISTYVENGQLDQLPTYLAKMVNRAKTIVPSNLHSKSPIFLMATAGLRILTTKHARNLMEASRAFLANSSNNPFEYSPQGVRILSGEEEGVYAWISTNYLMNYFGSNKAPSKAYGILEMGGGSTQIVFLPDGPLLANMFRVRIAGAIYSLYAHSYLFYGQDLMTLRINRYLYDQDQRVKEIVNPCMLTGDNSTYTDEDTAVAVIVRGGGNPPLCLTLLEYFLQSADKDMCYPKPCAIGQTYQPPVGTDIFYAISAFYYAPNALKVLGNSKRLRIEHLNETAHIYCRKNLSQAVVDNDVVPRYASGYCMMGLYIPTLITSAYGFPKNTTKIYIADKIGNQAVDWAMGAMLYEIESIDNSLFINTCPEVSISPGHKSRTLIVIISILITYVVRRL